MHSWASEALACAVTAVVVRRARQHAAMGSQVHAGKTGTTNKNTDAWFIGFTSNLVVGVYVGHDAPKSLGKIETGSKAAMPIFKEFIKNSINNYEARPFKVAKGIKMMVVDSATGEKADFGSKKTLIESFKEEKIENMSNIVIDNLTNNESKNNILKFY